MASKSQVKVDDSKLKKWLKRVDKYQHKAVRVGVLGSKAAEAHGDVTVAHIAALHELGAGVPRRSWLRDWVNANRKQIADRMSQALKQVSQDQQQSDAALRIVGLWAVGQIQKRLTNGLHPPLAQSTIEAKGSSTPLIDTGQLRSSITSDVEG